MRRATLQPLLILSAVLTLLLLGLSSRPQAATAANQLQQGSPTTTIKVSNTVVLPNAKRLGLNVGYHDQFGASQILKNLIPNPGFEGAEFASIILAEAGASRTRVRAAGWSVKNIEGLGGPDFWNDGTYEVLTGPARGRSGQIQQVYIDKGNYVFRFKDSGTPPPAGSVIAIRSQRLNSYFMPNRSANVTAAPGIARPGSPGIQSLRVKPVSFNADPFFFVAFDSLARDGDPSAGKLRLVDGNWQLSFWVKAEKPNTSIEFSFQRHKGVVFHKETLAVGQGWQQVSRNIYVPPGTDNPFTTTALMVSVAISRGDGAIFLDDMSLLEAGQQNRTVFSDTFVNLLKELNPGVLRDWGLQFGSSLDSQLANQFARPSNGFHPHKIPKDWHYSLHEFLQLSKEVGAEPWYVIPPTWSSAEIQNLIAYLSAPNGSHPYANHRAGLGQPAPWTNVFSKIHLEFGNELWGYNADNQPGQGFAMGGAIGTADAADNRFSLMRRTPHFNPSKFNLIVSGQVNAPDLQGQIERRLGSHNSIGIAPYFGDLVQFGRNEDLFLPLYADAAQDVAPYGRVQRSRASMDANGGSGTELAIYEVNTQLRAQIAPLAVRNEWYTALGTGLALPLHMLTYQRDLGINVQTAFTAAQYSKPVRYGEWDRVWGLLRDIEATGQKRPGWLGMDLANDAIRGDMIETTQSGANPHWSQLPANGITQKINVPYVQSFAYKGAWDRYSIVVFNLHMYSPQSIQLQLPVQPGGNATIKTLTGPNVRSNNESAETVTTSSVTRYFGQWEKLELPPNSMTVIQWNQ